MKLHTFAIATIKNISHYILFLSAMYCILDGEYPHVQPTGRYEAGQEVAVTCLKPRRHVLLSDKEITCQDSGDWSSEPDCRVCGKGV